MTGDTLLEFVNNDLFPKVKELPGGSNGRSRGFVVRGVFENALQYMKNGTLFGEGVKTRIKEKLLDECNLHQMGKRPNSSMRCVLLGEWQISRNFPL